MELIPLVKLALSIFTVLTLVIVAISYVVYKIKQKQNKGIAPTRGPIIQSRPKAQQFQVQQPQQLAEQQDYHRQNSVPPSAKITAATMREQGRLANQRAQQLAQQQKYQPRRPEQRFQVVNDQSKYRNHQIFVDNPADKPFYHPSNSPAAKAQQQAHQSIPEVRPEDKPVVQRPASRPVPPNHAPPQKAAPQPPQPHPAADKGDIFSRYSSGTDKLGKINPADPKNKK